MGISKLGAIFKISISTEFSLAVTVTFKHTVEVRRTKPTYANLKAVVKAKEFS